MRSFSQSVNGPSGRILILALVVTFSLAVSAQTQPEQFWLAGRYVGDRILIYFQAVKFNHTIPQNARRLPDAVVDGFFDQVELPANYIAQFQKGPGTEHFALGDQYDLLTGDGDLITVTLSTLLGSESDEDVGNDSYIGALATVNRRSSLFSTRGYYVLRPHREVYEDAEKRSFNSVHSGIVDEPVRSDIQTRMALLLNERMKAMANDDQQREAERVPPALAVQPFRVADGSLRYYVRAEWKSANQTDRSSFVLAAWMAPKPTLHILAVETRNSGYRFDSALPKLLNAVDLGGGRTAIIVSTEGDDSRSLNLLQYSDGLSLRRMPSLQSVGCAE